MNLIFSTINRTKSPSIIINSYSSLETPSINKKQHIQPSTNSILFQKTIKSTYNMFSAIQTSSNCNCGK